MIDRTLTPDVLPGQVDSQLGEGPSWSGSSLSWVDIVRRKLHVATLDGEVESFVLPQMPGFAVPHAAGGWIVGFQDGLWRGDASLVKWRQIWHSPHPTATHRLNDGKVDPSGRLWFGSMTFAEQEPISTLYRQDANGITEQVPGIVTSNGLDWSPDHRTFYYTDSIPRVIWAFDYDDASGDIRNRRVFTEDPQGYVPDGAAIDNDGCLWSCKWRGARIVRYTPDARVDMVLHLPVTSPTSCTFVGADRSILAVTTAHPTDGAPAKDLDGAVLLIPTTTNGPASTPASYEE